MPPSKSRAHLTHEALELIAKRFRVLGEASRLRLLIALEDGELNVTALVKATGLTQANVSRQLKELTAAGVLGRRKEGLTVIYHVADSTIFEMCDHVCGSLHHRGKGQAAIFSGTLRRRVLSAIPNPDLKRAIASSPALNSKGAS